MIKQVIPTHGRALLLSIEHFFFHNCAVFCAPEAWEMVEDHFLHKPLFIAVPQAMEQSILERQIDNLPTVETIFGIGGGSAIDAAKMYAWKRKSRLILLPTILSVDAPYTKAIGVRVNHRVRYVGEVYPDHLLIDFDLIRRSPHKLTRGGIGDILSIFTALADWRLAHDHVGEAYDAKIAKQSKELLDRLMAHAAEIRDCTEKGVHLLSTLFVAEVGLCEIHGNSRPEEGSEHYFAYCVEALTKRSYLHGELIALGVLLSGLYQGQDVEPVVAFLRQTGLDFAPAAIGISVTDIRDALLALPQYLAEETQLPYGIFHHRGIDAPQADRLIDELMRFSAGGVGG